MRLGRKSDKKLMVLIGGPWAGHKVLMPPITMVFRVGRFHGCYVGSRWMEHV